MTVTQDLQKHWQTVTFKDNFIFGKTLELFPDLCLQVVEMITNFKIKHISYPEREKTIDARIDSKGIRLDVYVEDEHNRSFDLEMQISNAHDLLKRTRYYQGLIDLEKLKKGNHYSSLGESFIIFICPFQLFGQNQHKYIWQTKCIIDTPHALRGLRSKACSLRRGILEIINAQRASQKAPYPVAPI